MSDRAQALTITFADFGKGSVVRDVDEESLTPPNASGVLSPTILTKSANVDLYEGLAIRRDGYAAFETVQADTSVHGVFAASFDPGKRVLVAGYKNNSTSSGAVEAYNEAADSWTIITPSAGPGNFVTEQPWRFAMVPSATETPANRLIFGSLGTGIYLWDGSLTANSAIPLNQTDNLGSPTAAKFFVSFLSRAMALNIIDENGNSHPTRIAHSIVGDSTNWLDLGSGTLALDRDPFPIAAGAVMGGRLVVLKGAPEGGAIYVLTPTGVSASPMRVDAINPDTNVGVLVPRSFIPIATGVAFFLGHDAAYIYDGVRALQPFARGVARDIRSRVNKKAIETGFAIYNREKNQVELHVAVGSSTVPNEVWTFDVREQRAWGPHAPAKTFLSSTHWIPQGTLSWDTWGQDDTIGADPVNGRSWDTLLDADDQDDPAGVEYFQWDLVKGDLGTEAILYGANDGITYKNEGTQTDDAGTNIACEIDLPPITPAMWMRDPSSGKRYRADDVFVLRTVTLRHRSITDWVPVVKVSIDGTNYVTISDGSTAAATGDGTTARLIPVTYYPDNNIGPSVWFKLRIGNTTGDNFSLKDLQLEFTYAGNLRHE